MRYLLILFFTLSICSCKKDIDNSVVKARKQNYWTIESVGEYGTDSINFSTPRLIVSSGPYIAYTDSMNIYKDIYMGVHLDIDHPNGEYKLLNATTFLNNISSSVPKVPGDHEMHIIVQWKGLLYRNYDAPVINGTLFDSAGQQYLRGRQSTLKQQNDRSDILKLDFLICISRNANYKTKDKFFIKINDHDISQEFYTSVTKVVSYNWYYTIDSSYGIGLSLPSIPYEDQSLPLGRSRFKDPFSKFEAPYLHYNVNGKSYYSNEMGSPIHIRNTGANFIAEVDSVWLKSDTGDSVLMRNGHFVLK